MRKTMKEKKQMALDIMGPFTFNRSNGNDVWTNTFYHTPSGILWNIQYKSGKLFDVICYGR